MKLELCTRLSTLPRASWDALVADESPFLEWGWLASLEDSGCVARETGWVPQHLLLRDGERLVGACPLYVKGHSQGEFVFDHGWAEAAEQAGISYYPKLLVAVPFTPATGARFLSHPDVDHGDVVRILGEGLREICLRNQLSSAHVNFCTETEAVALGGAGFEVRRGYQFQWLNQGWTSFDEYLGALRSKRRGQIRRERRELRAQDVEVTVHAGDALPDSLFEPMFRLYKTTIDKLFWGRQYLNLRLFQLLQERWRQRLCFFVARRRGDIVAGTFTVRKGEVLYGRYWGAFEQLRFLHFNLCYYAAIEHCLREGIARFEPGAGGEFKHLRGFDACPTRSMHFIAEPRLADAVRRFLSREREAVSAEMNWLDTQSALRRPPAGDPADA
jgi:predicted N-acyltransferase